MSYSNANKIIEAEQIGGNGMIFVEQPKSQNNQIVLSPQINKECSDFQENKVASKYENEEKILYLQIEARQLEKAIHSSHWLGVVLLTIITTIKLFGLNLKAKESIALAILLVFSLLLWIVSVLVGTIGIKRQLMKSLLLYQIGLILSLTFDLTGTIVIFTTDHQINHQFEKYGNNHLVRIIIFMVLEFMSVCFYIMLLRSIRQIKVIFEDIDRLQNENINQVKML